MTVEMPMLCFAGRCKLALHSPRVRRTSIGSILKAITPQAACYISNAVQEVTCDDTRSGANAHPHSYKCEQNQLWAACDISHLAKVQWKKCLQ